MTSLRIERCDRIERRLRDGHSLRAELCWEEDRRREAARLGGQIRQAPAEVVEELRRTPQGCEWLIARWAMLAFVADLNMGWTPEQTRLAFDLLGTPAEFREGFSPGTAIDLEGRIVRPADNPSSVARREIAELRASLTRIEDLDQAVQALAMAGLVDDDPDLRWLHRYEETLYRRLRWCLDRLRMRSPAGRDSSSKASEPGGS